MKCKEFTSVEKLIEFLEKSQTEAITETEYSYNEHLTKTKLISAGNTTESLKERILI